MIMAEYAKLIKGVKVEQITCPHNDACKCIEQNCNKCGWNPAVAKQRKDAML